MLELLGTQSGSCVTKCKVAPTTAMLNGRCRDGSGQHAAHRLGTLRPTTRPELLRQAIASDEGFCIAYVVVNPGFLGATQLRRWRSLLRLAAMVLIGPNPN